jgi:hypothetical protein
VEHTHPSTSVPGLQSGVLTSPVGWMSLRWGAEDAGVSTCWLRGPRLDGHLGKPCPRFKFAEMPPSSGRAGILQGSGQPGKSGGTLGLPGPAQKCWRLPIVCGVKSRSPAWNPQSAPPCLSDLIRAWTSCPRRAQLLPGSRTPKPIPASTWACQ